MVHGKDRTMLLYLDFDGVISPLHPEENPDFDRNDYHEFRLSGFGVLIRKDVIDFLQRLDPSQVIWNSTWSNMCASFHEESGGIIPEFPHRYIESGADIVFGIVPGSIVVNDSGNVIRNLRNQQRDLTLIQPKPEVGLTERQMKLILRKMGS